MKKSLFILNDKELIIKSINYKDNELSIETSNNFILNVGLNLKLFKLDEGKRENISDSIYKDQNFVSEKLSYVFDIGNDVYLTKFKDCYLLEINIPKVNLLIPPFDNINNIRLEPKEKYEESEINKLEVKIYFNCWIISVV